MLQRTAEKSSPIPLLPMAAVSLEAAVTLDKGVPALREPEPAALDLPGRIERALRRDENLFDKSALHGKRADGSWLSRLYANSQRAILVGAASTAALLPAAAALSGGGELFGMAIVGGIIGAIGGVLAPNVAGLIVDKTIKPKALPLSAAAQLTQAAANGDALERAIVANQARTWVDRLDQRNVTGAYVRRQLSDLAAAATSGDRATQEAANTAAGMLNALRDWQGGPLRELTTVEFLRIQGAFLAQPEAERSAVAAYLLAKLYKNEVCRFEVRSDLRSQQACRDLLATLVACTPMPTLPAPHAEISSYPGPL